MNDLDITQHLTEVPFPSPTDPAALYLAASRNSAESADTPYIARSDTRDTLTPAEAKAYMQQLAVHFRDRKRI